MRYIHVQHIQRSTCWTALALKYATCERKMPNIVVDRRRVDPANRQDTQKRTTSWAGAVPFSRRIPQLSNTILVRHISGCWSANSLLLCSLPSTCESDYNLVALFDVRVLWKRARARMVNIQYTPNEKYCLVRCFWIVVK